MANDHIEEVTAQIDAETVAEEAAMFDVIV